MGGLFNKTESKVDKNATTVSYGLQLSYFRRDFNIYLIFIYDNIRKYSYKYYNIIKFNIIKIYTLYNCGLAINASYNYNTVKDKPNTAWWGMGNYIHRKLNKIMSLGTRIKYFDDTNGYIGVAGKD